MERSGAKVEGGFFERGIHAFEACLHANEDEWKGEGDVGNDDGEVTEGEGEEDKEHEEANAHKNFRHDHGDKDKGLHEAMGGETVAVEEPGAEGSEESSAGS